MYNFPFDTCEIPRPDSWIAQPWSALVNTSACLIIVAWIVYAHQKSCPIHILWLMGCLLLFEIIHTYSHIYHLKGRVQAVLIHLTAYLTLGFYTYALLRKYGWPRSTTRNTLLIGLLIMIAVCDAVWFLQQKPFLWYVYTVVGMFIILFVLFFPRFTPLQKQLSCGIIAFATTVLLLFWNESHNCQRMLRWNALPYHALIEFVGLIIFILVPWFFSTLCR